MSNFKITRNKMKANVKYEHKFGTCTDTRVIVGNSDIDDYSIVKVRPLGDDWSIPKKSDLLILEEYGSGFNITIPAHGTAKEQNLTLDYSDAFHLLVALTAELTAKNHKLTFEWTKTTEEFVKGNKRL